MNAIRDFLIWLNIIDGDVEIFDDDHSFGDDLDNEPTENGWSWNQMIDRD
jgi:hypothetical protein